MQTIEFTDGSVNIEAQLIATDLGLEPDQVLPALREGRLTSLCERGIEQDEGRFRVTFFHAGRRLRLTVDNQGNVLQRVSAERRSRLKGHGVQTG